ncbi:sigma-54-dependent Fis family transcriptional regulator [Erwinia rhapontici]|uniref:sigma-54-dependent Fis family transcriptional regulator n=1 Tax=Erwinia rhapontici TaxID=55212 RepID=UPI001061D456|nr:sigma-54-dependent Fis family transcriptional regulator [Erwinia rhapontici]TDS99885.1 transcriptional regulator of acetoin/glycerol metabolism [Erwinia rhapontici]
MNQSQREHIATVLACTRENARHLAQRQYDQTIRDSWQRCVIKHGLDPSRMQAARILPWQELREHREHLEEFRHIARHGLSRLYQQIAPAGYVVLLTDAHGVTVDYLGDDSAEISLRRAGLFLGAQWSEAWAGTCAVGTALATGKALTVHHNDHFDATHIALSCSAVPLFDPQGQLNAILDISALTSPQPKSGQQLALQIARMHAHQIENAWFEHRHRADWVLKLSPSSPFVEVSPDYLIAFDADGRVIGHNHRAQRMLEKELGIDAPLPHCRSTLLGMPIEQLFNTSIDSLPDWLASASGRQGTLDRLHSGERLYVTAVQPARRPERTAITTPAALPAPLAALTGGDPALQQQLQRASRLLSAPLHLVVQGETGSGKEYFARAFHQSSQRSGQPFIAVNCAAIPATLIESVLFGHLPGSFSGAGSKARRGLVQEADGGTLFLDEIGDMPLEMQTRLLRVLAEQEVLPVGASRPVAVDIRVISASHHVLEELVEQGRFRADLFWRLQGARITLPALRNRQDLDWLIDNMLAGKARLSAAARQCLHQHGWPGNLRELSNALDYAVAMADGDTIDAGDLPDGIGISAPLTLIQARSAEGQALPDEGQQLVALLRAARWNHSAVARQLGISRMTLYRRMQRYGIQSPNTQPA